MRKLQNQLSFSDIFDECKDMFDNDKSKFISLLENYIDFRDFIPAHFYNGFYRNYGRNRTYPLSGFISSFIMQKILSIPTDSLLITFLKISKELRDFCGFDKVPDASKFTRFKQEFFPYLLDMFNKLVDYTEPICQKINPVLADMLIYDTSGIEAYVTENNDKYINTLIRKLKNYYKGNEDVDPYKMAYGLMPSHAEADSSIKQMYINGHFCYVHKFGLITNGLGITRHISFLDDEFKAQHPEIIIDRTSISPDEDKSIGDSTSLQPVLNDFFSAHPNLSYSTFLGDSAFDKVDHYTFLIDSCGFKKVLIPINPRNESSLPPVGYNEFGYPLCPNDSSLVMKKAGITIEEGRSDRIKWICPKVKMSKGQCICSCEEPCSTAKYGRTTYTYNDNFRMLPGIVRNSEEWDDTYKIRCAVERAIDHYKTNMCVANRRTRNLSSTKADILFAGIAQLFTVILADKLNQLKYFRSIKPLIV